MSTCPDPGLFSAFVDNEVPSPWKERLEAHIETCAHCRTRVEHLRNLSHACRTNVGDLSDEWLETSLCRMEQKRHWKQTHKHHALAAKAGKIGPFHAPSHISFSLPALAALFLAAIFVPAYISHRSTAAVYTAKIERQQALPVINPVAMNTTNSGIMNTSIPVYSLDMPERTLAAHITTPVAGQQFFTMMNFARQFATDKELFSDAEIIIIKLPKLAQFSNTAITPVSEGETLQTSASYFK